MSKRGVVGRAELALSNSNRGAAEGDVASHEPTRRGDQSTGLMQGIPPSSPASEPFSATHRPNRAESTVVVNRRLWYNRYWYEPCLLPQQRLLVRFILIGDLWNDVSLFVLLGGVQTKNKE